MSLIVSTDVDCDRCGNWTHGVVGGRNAGRRARAVASKQGWSRRRVGDRLLDLCDLCGPVVADELAGPAPSPRDDERSASNG